MTPLALNQSLSTVDADFNCSSTVNPSPPFGWWKGWDFGETAPFLLKRSVRARWYACQKMRLM